MLIFIDSKVKLHFFVIEIESKTRLENFNKFVIE
jgi:hypothetical protein